MATTNHRHSSLVSSDCPYNTSCPSGQHLSRATLMAMLTAATLLGWVTPTQPFRPRPDSRIYCGGERNSYSNLPEERERERIKRIHVHRNECVYVCVYCWFSYLWYLRCLPTACLPDYHTTIVRSYLPQQCISSRGNG